LLIGTAGHVDHGKTTLVRALTGVAGDRLPEERRRGMTIDLGYAYAGEGPLAGVGFVDVPGHERLVATMLAGAGGIDAALLAVAADDGVMPQTVEHAQVLDLLGIAQGVVAITRADLALTRVPEVAGQVRRLLAGSALADAPVLAVDAVRGTGVAALLAALSGLRARARDAAGHARLSVDRAFVVEGAGLVVTGTLVAGRVAVGDRLVVSPAGHDVRVRGLHVQNRAADHATAGQRVALNLAGVARGEVVRGDWVLHPAVHAPTARLDVQVRGVVPPRQGMAVHLHLAATHVTARLDALGDGLGRLTADRPIGALAGDRFVLRDAAARRTLGGGVVLDPFPPRRGARTPARLHLLAAGVQPPAQALAARIAQGPVDFAVFARAHNLPDGVQPAILAAAGAVAPGGIAVAPATLAGLRTALTGALAAHHAAQPDQPGLPAGRLRGRTPAPLFAAVLAAARQRGEVQQDGPWLRLPSHRIVLSPQDERVWQDVARHLAAERFRPPRTRDLAGALHMPEADLRTALKRFARLGRIVEVAHDHFFLPATLAEIVRIAAGIEQRRGAIVIGELRNHLDNGRKVAIQILEFLDSAGVTRRQGDQRWLRRDRCDLFGPAPA
jgi:selenocysteine-specific elongation factor